MRTIKFRGKDEDGKWVYGDLMHLNVWSTDHVIIKGRVVDPKTVGQFVWKRGNHELYEGDVLQGRGYTLLIAWDAYSSRFWLEELGGDEEVLDCRDLYAYAVIGNIHDDPELLKTKP